MTKNEFELLADYLNTGMDELAFLYQLDPIETSRYYDPNWNRRTKKMMSLSFKQACKWRKDREIVNNILIVGEEGSGKTNTIMRVRNYLMKLYNLENFYFVMGKHLDLRLHVVLQKYNRNSLIIVDEADEIFKPNTTQTRSIRSTLAQIRKYNVHFLFVTPHFSNIDKSILQKNIHWLIICTYNDHSNKCVITRIEYNGKHEGLAKQDYYLHSRLRYKWVSEKEFRDYDQIALNYGMDTKNILKDFHSEVKNYEKSLKKEVKIDQSVEVSKIKDELVEELRQQGRTTRNRDDLTGEIKEKYGIRLFEEIEDIAIGDVRGVCKVGEAVAKGYMLEAHKRKRESEEPEKS